MFYYYGRKQKIFGKYPKPQFDTIIEPFAGSAAYSMNYYKKNILNPVSCCLIAFLLATGRRTDEAASLTWDRFLQGDNPRIKLIESKTSKKNNKLIFNIGDEAKTTLQLIQNDRLNNNQSKFYFPIESILL